MTRCKHYWEEMGRLVFPCRWNYWCYKCGGAKTEFVVTFAESTPYKIEYRYPRNLTKKGK